MPKTWKLGEDDVLVEPQSFTTVRDDWSVYELSPSGVKVRIRVMVAKVALKLDENGEVIRNEDGDLR